MLIDPMDGFQIIWMKIPASVRHLRGVAVGALSGVGVYFAGACTRARNAGRYRSWFRVRCCSSGRLFRLFCRVSVTGSNFCWGSESITGIRPGIDMNKYYDLFVDVMLGVGVIFEIPVMFFLLTLIHVVSPAFLVRHSRYAILMIVILAAVITPTGDVFNLSLFATPMIILFYLGIFASYLLVLHREKRKFPWAHIPEVGRHRYWWPSV